MLRMICVSALAGLVAVSPGLSQAVPVPDWQLRVGKYHLEEAALKVGVDLNANGTTRYQVNAERAVGFWAVRSSCIPIHKTARIGELGGKERYRVILASPSVSSLICPIALPPQDWA